MGFVFELNVETLILATAVYTAVLAWGDWLTEVLSRQIGNRLFREKNDQFVLFLVGLVCTLVTLALLAFVGRNSGDILGIDYLTLLPNGHFKQA